MPTKLQLDGYNCITHGKHSVKGGLIIYVDSKYTYEVIRNLNNYELLGKANYQNKLRWFDQTSNTRKYL